MTDPIHIDDLTSPTFTPEVRAVLDLLDTMGAEIDLTSEGLHRQASEDTGLHDFGPTDYRERLDVLLGAFADVPNLTGAGRFSHHAQLLQMLKTRLLLTDLVGRHPEILEIELVPPIVIAGLPRTGTTHLHNLLAADPGLRSLPYWESIEPVPLPAEVGIEPDPRRERTDLAVSFMNQAMPLFPLMHEMTTDHVHEEIALLAVDFSTMFFETIAWAPAWRSYYLDHDQRPHYRFLRTMLAALQFLRGGERWVLKSPQHLEQLGVLADVFPDSPVVVTHRDPAAVVVSMATMVAYTSRMHAFPVDAAAIGPAWADRIEIMLTSCVADRDLLGPERSMDVRFDEFMADDLAMVRRIYELSGQPLTSRASDAQTDYLSTHERGRHGRIDYRADDLGLDVDELVERFAFYTDRFLPS